MEYTEDQASAVRGLRGFAEAQGGEAVLTGLAGTGKTTVVAELVKEWEAADVQVLAPTGKAASVLRSKGLEGASTLHSFLYYYRGSYTDERTNRSVPTFEDKEENARGLLLVVDEASMVNTKLAEDLRRTGGDILWVGDQGQLPPVGPDPQILSHPDYTLSTIVRQAEGSPIVRLAHDIRGQGDRAVYGYRGGGVVVHRLSSWGRFVGYAAENADVVLCGYNRTRMLLNQMLRDRIHNKPEDPVIVGDVLVCLLNDHRRGVFNGEQWRVVEIGEDQPRADEVVCRVTDGEEERWVRVWLPAIGVDPKGYDRDSMPDGANLFDYGYALTVHKSQGSEWDRVAVVWEPFGEDRSRWAYTAVTRAKSSLAIGLR